MTRHGAAQTRTEPVVFGGIGPRSRANAVDAGDMRLFDQAIDSDVETPFICLDAERLDRNLGRVHDIAPPQVEVRPHAKTHKSLWIARRQLRAGAVGFTVAKPGEAEVFAEGGAPSLTVAFPLLSPAKIRRVADAAAARDCAVRFVVDSALGAQAVAEAARACGRTLDVMAKVDVGLGRCGVEPTADAVRGMFAAVETADGIRFDGLISHAGNAYGAADLDGVRAVARRELELMNGLRDALVSFGADACRISVGSTPTVLFNAGFEGVDEIRPGNYALLDRTAVTLGIAALADVAIGVVATTVSVGADRAVIDAGSKTLTSDVGPLSAQRLRDYGLAVRSSARGAPPCYVDRLSEEHGVLRAAERELPELGERVVVFPNHACPVMNLARRFHVSGRDGLAAHPVDAGLRNV